VLETGLARRLAPGHGAFAGLNWPCWSRPRRPARAYAAGMTDTDTKPPIETANPPHQLDVRQPCRIASAESNMRGECLRCGSKPGERCPMQE
jgi:hypothetical protein